MINFGFIIYKSFDDSCETFSICAEIYTPLGVLVLLLKHLEKTGNVPFLRKHLEKTGNVPFLQKCALL